MTREGASESVRTLGRQGRLHRGGVGGGGLGEGQGVTRQRRTRWLGKPQAWRGSDARAQGWLAGEQVPRAGRHGPQ